MSSEKPKYRSFEPKKSDYRSSLDEHAVEAKFWGEFPSILTPSKNVVGILHSGETIRLQVPGFLEFYIKPFPEGTQKNGAWILAGVSAINRQGETVAGAYLVCPEEIQMGKVHLLRNSDRYPIRKFTTHYEDGISLETDEKSVHQNLKDILSRDIKSLAFLDKKVF